MIIETTSLVERIEDWPQAWKDAWARYTQAHALVARLEQQLETALEAATIPEETEYPDPGNEAWHDLAGDNLGSEQRTGLRKPEESSRQLLDLEYQLQMAQAEVARAKGSSDLGIRGAAHANGLKLTEAAVEARVACDPAVMAAQDHVLSLKHQLALAKLDQEVRWNSLHNQHVLRMAGGGADESAEIVALRAQLEQAREEVASARVNVKYQRAVGYSLRLLVRVSKDES